eukprot:TRINITY_DN50829_c0_g1_i1.p1 TRINITY_DN50829_c0_g1~~TRINITY_DN50829_c0_g1_i1.p1  ORF type:complete len:551 (+),score=118.51 TRINITY_DN50829_c0_g1_i1:100-1653(+)
MEAAANRIAEQARQLLGCWVSADDGNNVDLGEISCLVYVRHGLLSIDLHIRTAANMTGTVTGLCPLRICLQKADVFWHISLPRLYEGHLWLFLRGDRLHVDLASGRHDVRMAGVLKRKHQGIAVEGHPSAAEVWPPQLTNVLSPKQVAGNGTIVEVQRAAGLPSWLQHLAWRAEHWKRRPVTRINGKQIANVHEAQEEIASVQGTAERLLIEYSVRGQEIHIRKLLGSVCRQEGCSPPPEWCCAPPPRLLRGAGDPFILLDAGAAAALAGMIDAHGKQDDPMFKEFTCAICTTHACRAAATTTCCGHAFHKPCIERALQGGAPCPMCQNVAQPGKDCVVDAPAFVQRAMGKATVQCPQRCGSLLPFDALEGHLLDKTGCPSTPVLCRHSGCKSVLKRSREEGHTARTCKYARIDCAACGQSMRRIDAQAHEKDECPQRAVPCMYCKKSMPCGAMEAHLRSACAELQSIPVQEVFAMREALAKSDLPAPWAAFYDVPTGRWCFKNSVTGAVVQEKPKA